MIIYECLTDESPQEEINHLESGTGDTRRLKRMEIRVLPEGESTFFFSRKKMCCSLSE